MVSRNAIEHILIVGCSPLQTISTEVSVTECAGSESCVALIHSSSTHLLHTVLFCCFDLITNFVTIPVWKYIQIYIYMGIFNYIFNYSNYTYIDNCMQNLFHQCFMN